MPPSSSGQGCQVLNLETRVQFPQAVRSTGLRAGSVPGFASTCIEAGTPECGAVWLAHLVWDQGVGGSSPPIPTGDNTPPHALVHRALPCVVATRRSNSTARVPVCRTGSCGFESRLCRSVPHTHEGYEPGENPVYPERYTSQTLCRSGSVKLSHVMCPWQVDEIVEQPALAAMD